MRRIAVVLILITLAFTAIWNTSRVVAQGETGRGSLLGRLHDRLMGRTPSDQAEPSASGRNTTHTSRSAPHSHSHSGTSQTSVGSSKGSAAESWARQPSPAGTRVGANTQANGRSGAMSINTTPPRAAASTSSALDGRTANRMHERLSAFQQSAFPSQANAAHVNRSASLPTTDSTVAGQPARPFPAAMATPAASSPNPAPPIATAPNATQATPAARTPTMALPTVQAPTASATRVEPTPALSEQPSIGGPTSSNPTPTFAARSLMSRTTSSRPDESSAADNGPTAPAVRSPDRVLFTQVSPALWVETIGPRQIAIGKEATFEVSIRNGGEVAAEETSVIVTLPPSADFMRADTSVGSARSEAVDGENRQVRWAVGRVAPGGAEKLTLVIIPRENRPFDLAVRWDHRPVSSQAMIEVQEAKVTMRLDGPADVLFGEEEVYRLELSNTGNGPAREIVISLTPVGAGANASVNHTIRELAAGETKVIQVELTARQTGQLTIDVDATGDGVHAHLEERITVRRAALAVEVDAPPMQFVGTQVTHQIRVRNTGTAAASQVQIAALIPPGASYVSSSARGVVNDDHDRVVWLLTELAAGAEKDFEIVCVMDRAGTSRLEVVCNAQSDLTASDVAVVQVEAMADLAMEVHDPAGPVAIGADAVYTIRIENRGTKGAENIDLKAFFSPGIEPVNVEGGTHRLATGLVTFERIPSLAAGQSMSFEITARAQTPGSHVFRAELTCKPIGADLVSQETTHFYGNAAPTTPAASVASETEEPSRLAEEEVRTARRPTPAGPSPIGPSAHFVPSGAFTRPSPISGSNGPASVSTPSSQSGTN